jgi:hypothetical protein
MPNCMGDIAIAIVMQLWLKIAITISVVMVRPY